MRLIIMGPPGAGKGTQAVLIKATYKIPHISTGEMFREAISNRTPLGIEANKYIEKGELAPDSITIELVKERLAKADCEQGFLLDGFPRTIAQAKFLDEILNELNMSLDAVLYIDVDTSILVDRIAGRRLCPTCGAGYHIETLQPQVSDICDKCGTKIIQRDDDKPQTVLNRIKVYDAKTKPLLDYYTEKNLVKTVNGVGNIKDIFENVQIILGGLNDNLKK